MNAARSSSAGIASAILLVLSMLACNFNRSPTVAPTESRSLATAAAGTVSAELTRAAGNFRSTPPESTAGPEVPTQASTAAPTSTRPVASTPSPSVCGEALPPRLSLNEPARVVVFQVNLRSAPGLEEATIGQLARDREVMVEEGPSCVDGLWWWVVSSDALQIKGWVAEADAENYFLAP